MSPGGDNYFYQAVSETQSDIAVGDGKSSPTIYTKRRCLMHFETTPFAPEQIIIKTFGIFFDYGFE